jgi:class 3 adenylate cyclase
VCALPTQSDVDYFQTNGFRVCPDDAERYEPDTARYETTGPSNHIGIGVFPDAKRKAAPYRRVVSRCAWRGGVELMHRLLPGVDIDAGRRHVAIMFADFVGLAGLVESIGTEMAFRQVAPVMDRLIALVVAHDGVVQHVVGGASMSVFGLGPKPDDEVTQAVSAGVALTSTDADPGALQVQIGIECGDVLISRSWEPAGFAVWGEAVATARRLCDAADPGTVVVGPRACAQAEPLDSDVRVAGTDYLGRGLGRRPTASALTRAEVAVARLVAEGLSNPQIAKRLYISRHTAETHMKHIFAKLGVSSRAELAARVASRLVRGAA